MPFAYKARLSVKDYRVVGRVRGVYHQYCFLFNSFCINGTHPYDDLLNQAQEIGGDSVINFVLERGTFSILLDLYSSQTTVANGLALKILETKTSSLEVYGE